MQTRDHLGRLLEIAVVIDDPLGKELRLRVAQEWLLLFLEQVNEATEDVIGEGCRWLLPADRLDHLNSFVSLLLLGRRCRPNRSFVEPI